MKQFTEEQISELKDIATCVSKTVKWEEVPSEENITIEITHLKSLVRNIYESGWVDIYSSNAFDGSKGLARMVGLEQSTTLNLFEIKDKFKHLDDWVDVNGKKVSLNLSVTEFSKLSSEEMSAVLQESGSRI